MALAVDENPTLAHSLGVQWRILGALLIREMLTRYGRHNIGFLWLFVEPMIFTLGVTANGRLQNSLLPRMRATGSCASRRASTASSRSASACVRARPAATASAL